MAGRHVVVMPEWYPAPHEPLSAAFVRDQVLAIARDSDVTVLAPPSRDAPLEVVDEGVRVLRPVPHGPRGRLSRLWRLRWLDRTVGQLAADGHRADILHAHVFSAGLLAVLVGRRRRLPVVVTEHLSDILEGRVFGWDATVARFTYSHAGLVCPVSGFLASAVLALEPRANCLVVNNVVDIEMFATIGRRKRQCPGRRLLFVGRLVRKKGVHDLIAAVRLLVDDDSSLSLDVIGDGPERGRLEAEANGLPIRFLGSRPRLEVASEMHRADVLVVPSHVETFGITAIEGLAAGLPVVTTSGVATSSTVAEFGGRIVPPGDPQELATALAWAVRQPWQPVPAVELESRFGAGAVATTWESIYSALGHPSQGTTRRDDGPRE